MTTYKCWIILRADGQAFCGFKRGEALFTSDQSLERCYTKRSIAESLIKAQKLTGCTPAEVERVKPG